MPIAIVLIGLFLSLYRIDAQSLWGNEAFSVDASSKSAAGMHDILIQDFVNPPLHYHLLHVWMRLLGTGSLQARLLSTLFGALAIGVSYLLGKYLFDRKTALLAASVLAVSQIRIQYSQEARSYELLLLLMVCAAYLLVRALYERSVLLWWAFVLATAAMLYTHYFSAFAAGVMYVYAFLFRRKYDLPLSLLISGVVVVGALLAPWLVSGVVEVARGYREGDCVLFVPRGIPLQWSIYYGDPSKLRAVTVGQALRERATCRRIWVVSYCRTDGTCDSAHRELQSLQQQYTPLELKRYFWMEVQLYGLNSSAAPAP